MPKFFGFSRPIFSALYSVITVCCLIAVFQREVIMKSRQIFFAFMFATGLPSSPEVHSCLFEPMLDLNSFPIGYELVFLNLQDTDGKSFLIIAVL